MFVDYFIKRPVVFLLALLMLAGGYCVLLGHNAWWDVLNYHLSNPWMLLNGTWGSPLMPAGAQSFLNPLPDLYYYFLFTSFSDHPGVVAFGMGLPTGLLAWQIYMITLTLWQGENKQIWAALVALLALTAAGTLAQIGVNTNEILLANGIIASFWGMCYFVSAPYCRRKYIYGAAFICGVVTGMKLTLAPFCMALLAGYLLQWKQVKHPFKGLCLFAVCGIGGFLLTNGYFMWKLYVYYGNPFFPYYNDIFKSSYFAPIYLTDTRKLPKTWVELIFYPFFWAFKPGAYSSESAIRDPRLALGGIAALFLSFRLWRKQFVPMDSNLLKTILVYATVGYWLWLVKFSVLRYAVVLEFLAGLLILLFIASCCRKRALWCGMIVSVWLVCTVISQDAGFTAFYDKVILFQPKKPVIEDNSLVYLLNIPSGYLSVVLNPKATYMGGFIYRPEEYPVKFQGEVASFYTLPNIFYRFKLEEEQKKIIARHEGPIYLISVDWPMKANPKTWQRFGLTVDAQDCQRFNTSMNIYLPPYAICRAYKK